MSLSSVCLSLSLYFTHTHTHTHPELNVNGVSLSLLLLLFRISGNSSNGLSSIDLRTKKIFFFFNFFVSPTFNSHFAAEIKFSQTYLSPVLPELFPSQKLIALSNESSFKAHKRRKIIERILYIRGSQP